MDWLLACGCFLRARAWCRAAFERWRHSKYIDFGAAWGCPLVARPSAQAKARRRGQERKSRKMRRGVAGGRDWSACRRHVPCTRSGCKIWSLVCHAASSLLWACVFAAASAALESRRHRSGRSQRGVVTTAPRHRRETACYHRCTAGCQKLQPWRTRSHRNNPKNVPRNRRPRRNAPTSPRSTVCKPPLAAL